MFFKVNHKNFQNSKNIDSAWTKKINLGKPPSSQDLLDHLHIIHNLHTGFTETIAKNCCDLDGKNSYELLLDIIDPRLHLEILDLACGSGVLLELCYKRFPSNLKLSGIDVNDKELKLAKTKLLNKDTKFYKAKAQDLGFIEDASKDIIFCHWALTLMDPIIPVLKTIKRILKRQGIFSAIVDGDSNSAPGYLEIHNIIYESVQKQFPNYGFLELGDSRVRSLKTLNKLIEQTFEDCDVDITPHVLSLKQTPDFLAKEVTGFFYASLVLSSKHHDELVLKLTNYFDKKSIDGLSKFNMPVNLLKVKKL